MTTAASALAVSACAHAGVGKLAGGEDREPASTPNPAPATAGATTEPFYGDVQSGIVTPAQNHSYFAALDLITTKREDVITLLQNWTAAAARLSQGQTAQPLPSDTSSATADSGDTLGMSPQRLTITFGFGAGLFTKNGQDRYGLAAQRPAALVDLPAFNGDQLVADKSDGDLSIQACADDPQVAFHAVRALAQIAYGTAQVRWAQTGFQAQAESQTPRNLMGFKDGTMQPQNMNDVVWVGSEGPAWMQNGSYAVVRRIRIGLEHWDRMTIDFQQQAVGRSKYTGAPLGKTNEGDPLDLTATDADGNLIIPATAHVRLAAPASNNGAQILRRGYSYNDGVDFTAERWPPWRQAMEYDAGLFFVAYQKDPRTAFIPIFTQMSKLDMMNQFTTHTGSGLFACPGGTAPGEYIGQKLFG